MCDSRGRVVRHTRQDKVHDHMRHETSLDVIQQILIPQPRLRLAEDFVLLAILPPLGHKAFAFPEVVTEVLDDEAGLCDGDRLCRVRGCDRDYGRFTEGMDLR